MGKIYRNMVLVTTVHNKRGKQFAFGVTQEPEPRTIFFPHWIINAFEITSDDQGCPLDCLFIEQEDDRNPVVVGILGESVKLQPSQYAGEFSGRPGTPDFEAIINIINRKPA